MGRAIDFSNCYIYHIVDKEGIVHYVGSTSNMNSRKSNHKYACKHPNDNHHHFDIYKYIRDNGGFENFEIIPIKKIENISNKTELRIAERVEMEKYTGLKNMIGSYLSQEERLQRNRQWSIDNPEKHYELKRQWRKNNPEKKQKSDKKYYESNKEKLCEYQRQYRLRKKQLEASDQ
jgi:hypothetical protein